MAIIRSRDQGLATHRGLDPFELMRDVFRWDPWREISRFAEGETNFNPSFEVRETKDSYVFKADLPGVKQEELDISFTGNRLNISGHREQEKREEGEQYYTSERVYGSFARSFTLPDGVDPDHIRAELREGVLTLAVPKKPEVQPKRIAITSGGKTSEKAHA